jgi:streptogramin lyase
MLGLALLPALLAVLLVPLHASAALNGYDVITEYAGSSLGSPSGIITGPDGNIWYVASTNNFPLGAQTAAVVKVDPSTGSILASYSVSSSCTGGQIAIGPDRNLWVMGACYIPGDWVYSKLFRITTAGTVTTFDLPLPNFQFGGPGFFTAGPNEYDVTGHLEKNLWFTEPDRTAIARLNPSTGVFTEFALPSGGHPVGIALGSDHNFWFTEPGQNRVGRITISGSITEYPLPSTNSRPFDLVIGPDGNLYFTENLSQVGRITTSGVIMEFTVPAPPARIKVGPDGNLWFSENTANKIGSMTLGGVVHDVGVPTATSGAVELAAGPDGNLWFTETSANKIARLGTRHNALVVDKTAVGFGSVPLATTPPTQRVTLANGGPDSLAAFTPSVSTTIATSGSFALAGDTCHLGAVAAGSSCYADVGFSPAAIGIAATGSLVFKTDAGLATEQSIKVGLSATVIAGYCEFTAISTDVPSPQSIGTTVTLSATSTGCPHPSPLYSFFLRTPDGVWSTVQGFGAATAFAWNTTGYTAGTYLIRVWVKDVNSATTSYEAFDTRTFTLTVPRCVATNLASNVASPEAVGTTINFTATSSGCPTPLFQWWVMDPSGQWSIAAGHDFAHSSSTFAWNTTGLAEGTYQIGVWARELGSSASYDAYAIATYTLTATHCSAVNLATSVASPQGTGSTITVTPTAVGCLGAQYRFWVRDAAGAWHIVQDYGPAGSYTWNAASTPVNTSSAGTFLLGVWARQPGSTNTYDAFAFSTFSLTSAPTCTVNIAPDKTSPQPLGTGATWNATAGGCATTPLTYEFWVNPPGGTWSVVQPYGTGNTFAWSGVYAGTYQVGVWVRQAGSTAAYDNFAFVTFTLTPSSLPRNCQSVNSSAAPVSPQAVGTSITVTVMAVTGCNSPEYRWWVRDTSGVWAMAQDYPVPGNTFSWSTAALPPGNYLIGVWARQAGSTATYEAYSFFTYSLTGPAPQVCSSVGISTDVASPQIVGTNITITASAVGCGAPSFTFFLAGPGSSFGLYQNYGVSNQFTWRMAGEGYDSVGGLEYFPGAYQIGVWARQTGSTASYESYGIITFDIQIYGGTCTTLAVRPSDSASTNTVDSASPQPVGTIITWRPAVTGCGPANYQFYVLGAGWATYVDYSYDSTLVWNTAGLPAGTYQISSLVFSFNDQQGVRVVSTFEIV